MGEGSRETAPQLLVVKKEEIFLMSESGELNEVEGIDALSAKVDLFETENGENSEIWQLALDEDVPHRVLCEILSCIRREKTRVHFVDRF